MEDKIIELLRKNKIGEEMAIYLAHELLYLFDISNSVCSHLKGSSRAIIYGVEHWKCYKCKEWIADIKTLNCSTCIDNGNNIL